MVLLSFIIPCYGSEKTIVSVIDEIVNKVSEKSDYDYEVIAVNDCSPDNVWSIISNIAHTNVKIKAVCLAKNANRPGAVMAGLRQATGDICIVMDDDGQCPVSELWRLLEPLDNGYDVSIANYPERKQSVFKDFGTAVNKKMTEVIIDRPKNLQFTNFMAIKRFVVDEINKYQNPYPYLTGLLIRTTQNIANVKMEERGRLDGGKTTFTFKKMLRLWLNGFTAFSVKPLRIATVMGFVCSFFGAVLGIAIIIRKLVTPDILMGYSSTMAVLLFIGGMIMLMLGMIGEYIGRIYICINNSPQYVIRETINIKKADEENVYEKN